MQKEGIALWVLILCIIIFFVFGLLIGSTVGFSTAVKNLSSCEEVPCEQVGITDASVKVCEVCKKSGGIRVLKHEG